jgi:hypothetical protein
MYRCTRRVSTCEPENAQNGRMPYRRPTRAERQRVITVDLLADWHPYAMPLPEPRNEYDWRYFGTITMDGETGAFAWRAGSYGFGAGARVRELGQWDRIKVNSILLAEPPGHASSPRFPPAQMFGMGQ